MVSSRLKEKFEGWVAPSVRILASAGLTPNALTLLGLAASFAAAFCYLNWRIGDALLPAAAALVLISGLLDALDGVLARAVGGASAFGGFLDSVADRYSDAVVLSAVVVAGLCDPVWGLAAVVGSIMVSYARARAEAAGVGMASVGLAERAERMLLLAAVTFAAYFRLDILSWGVLLLAALSHLTVLQRAVHFLRETGRRKAPY
ncbi:MAG: CDP-alcohol phosphatidyltransferase family protein [Candidatus Bathyarchaeota archaeon]|nr:CDP-alcohol phosphatidyltransferase family protein [Candidatus Bathyarchaeota archaeon]